MTEQEINFASDMLDFIHKSPSCFHVVRNIADILKNKGFFELKEEDNWNLEKGKSYFVTRNSSSIVSFKIPENDYSGFLITASHSDSPSFKIKENCEIKAEKLYTKLNIEKYGGMLCAPWFDRPLSVAGRVIIKDVSSQTSIKLIQKLVNIDRDLVMIPSLAIHMNRKANDGYEYNVQNDMLPVFSCEGEDISFMDVIAEACNVKKEDILSTDLFLYNRVKGTFWGSNNEFIACTKLDDLECVYTTLMGFADSSNSENVCVHAVFDNEEVGSMTRQGAESTFLHDVLVRINKGCKRSDEQYYMSLAKSFLVSADNAHACHPNYSNVADPVNRPCINKGPVIKFNAAQKYTSDSISSALFKRVCEKADVPYQIFTNRSDMAGGSTLGNISNTQVSIPAVDIGIAQWAMHSPYESAGSRDPLLMKRAISEFYCVTWDLAL